MFGKSVSPRGIETGGLRDDSFVSALRIIALDEDRVRRMIRSYSHRDAGCIVVRMYCAGMVRKRGMWRGAEGAQNGDVRRFVT